LTTRAPVPAAARSCGSPATRARRLR
jgi:hypothetical protein